MNEARNIDCMEYMKTVPDKYFDLAVVDPPYGGGLTEGGGCKGWFSKYHQAGEQPDEKSRFGGRFDRYKQSEVDENGKTRKKPILWDVAPPPEYFRELARVSKNQIIWGGNYFDLPPTRCFLVWRKLTISDNFTMAMAEYAWTSFNANAKVFEAAPQNAARFHPTQKPVELYSWIYRHFAKDGDKILDTHLGSGSSRIAAYDAGLDFVGCEIDKTYFDLQEKRFAEHSSQENLFLQMEL